LNVEVNHVQTLDFVVIGAQKAGTTTLFEHLRQHPQLYIPTSKEAAFFNRPELHERGVAYFFSSFFPDAPPDRKWGTVTPGYMCDRTVPERLAAAFPNVRLIAILRDPVERAYSHFRMTTRRMEETRSFSDAISQQLASQAMAAARASRSESETYVAWGEYGRILHSYLQLFPRERLHVVLTERLEVDPAGVMQDIHQFLGVPFLPPAGLGRRFHVGSSHERLPNVRRRLERPAIKHLWHMLPRRKRDLIFYRFNRWNIRSEDRTQGVPLDIALLRRLRDHYSRDAILLRKDLDLRVPW
jgi:sulfotransferase family protein